MESVALTTDPTSAEQDGDDIEYVPGIAYPRVAVLLVLAGLLAAGTTYLLSRPDTPGNPSAVDIGFVTDMRTHHQQAVEMALIELGNGENPVAVGFAREILVRQNVELGLMAAELDDWDLDGSRRPATAMEWMGTAVPYDEMPGLASDEEMSALRDASGAEADAMFLELMAEHHRGGIHMAAYAVDNARSDDVRRLAASMISMQSVEINEYRATAQREGLDADIDPYVVGEDPFAH